jgi:DNA replication protein DnaC
MTRPDSELAHLFRALKAPAAAHALPKLADRARAEEWSYEQFAAALLKTETDSREGHGGQARIKAARFPARKTLEEFDFSFQRSIKKTQVLHLGQLDFLYERSNIVALGPPGTGKSHLAIALGIRACLAGHRVAFKTGDRVGRDAGRRATPRPPGHRTRPAPAHRAGDLRRGRLHPIRSPSREPDVHARQPPL